MRVLIISDLTREENADAMYNALHAEGHEVFAVDLGRFFPQWETVFSRGLRRLARSAIVFEFNAYVSRYIFNIRPELVIIFKGMFVKGPVIESARANGCRTMVFYPDCHFNHVGVDIDELIKADIFVTTKSFQLDWLRSKRQGKRTHLVHHGYNSRVHKPVQAAHVKYDVSYIGNYTPHKEDWLSRIFSQLRGVRIAIFGNRWERSEDASLRRWVQHAVPTQQIAAVIAASRVNLALHSGPYGPLGWYDRVSTRTFELPACGGYMLHIDSEEVRELYSVGSEVDVFGSAEEAALQVRTALDDEGRRIAVAAAGFRRAVPAYSYDVIARTLIELAAA